MTFNNNKKKGDWRCSNVEKSLALVNLPFLRKSRTFFSPRIHSIPWLFSDSDPKKMGLALVDLSERQVDGEAETDGRKRHFLLKKDKKTNEKWAMHG